MDGQVVEQEQRLGAHGDQVVDVHGHHIDADRIEPSDLNGHQHLTAHAVRTPSQDGVAVVVLEEPLVVIQAEQTRELAVPVEDARAIRAAHG